MLLPFEELPKLMGKKLGVAVVLLVIGYARDRHALLWEGEGQGHSVLMQKPRYKARILTQILSS